jgi:hypothetical protein
MITISFISVFLTPALCFPNLKIFIQRGESLSRPDSYVLAKLLIKNGEALLEELFARVMDFVRACGLQDPEAICAIFWKAQFCFGPGKFLRFVALPDGVSVQRFFPEPFWADKLSLELLSPLEALPGGQGLLGLEGQAVLEKARELDGREEPRSDLAPDSDDGLCDLGTGLHRLLGMARATWGLIGSKELKSLFPELGLPKTNRPKFEAVPQKPGRKTLKGAVSADKPGSAKKPLRKKA